MIHRRAGGAGDRYRRRANHYRHGLYGAGSGVLLHIQLLLTVTCANVAVSPPSLTVTVYVPSGR